MHHRFTVSRNVFWHQFHGLRLYSLTFATLLSFFHISFTAYDLSSWLFPPYIRSSTSIALLTCELHDVFRFRFFVFGFWFSVLFFDHSAFKGDLSCLSLWPSEGTSLLARGMLRYHSLTKPPVMKPCLPLWESAPQFLETEMIYPEPVSIYNTAHLLDNLLEAVSKALYCHYDRYKFQIYWGSF